MRDPITGQDLTGLEGLTGETEGATFKFHRRNGRKKGSPRGFEIWLMRGNFMTNLSCYGLGTPPTLAEAMALAESFAEKHSLPFKLWEPPPPPTLDEQRKKKVNGGRSYIAMYDRQARAHEKKSSEYRQAAESWMMSAEHCVNQVRLEPAAVEHYKTCAMSRLQAAIECIQAWKTMVSSTRRTAGLRIVHVQPPEDP